MAKKNLGIKNRGFAALKKSNPQRQLELASKGGVMAHKLGVGHKWTSEEAREAGKIGGRNRHKKRG